MCKFISILKLFQENIINNGYLYTDYTRIFLPLEPILPRHLPFLPPPCVALNPSSQGRATPTHPLCMSTQEVSWTLCASSPYCFPIPNPLFYFLPLLFITLLHTYFLYPFFFPPSIIHFILIFTTYLLFFSIFFIFNFHN